MERVFQYFASFHWQIRPVLFQLDGTEDSAQFVTMPQAILEFTWLAKAHRVLDGEYQATNSPGLQENRAWRRLAAITIFY